MADEKVIRFPAAWKAHKDERHFVPAKIQPSLFDHDGANIGKIVFLDISWLAEDTLLNLVARNGVTALIDLRPRPVFERPRFRHRHVVRYLYEQNVHYLEYAMLARTAVSTGVHSPSWQEGAKAHFCAILPRGLTVCLYDEGSRSAGWIDHVRHLVRTMPSYLAEVNPRALVGSPEAERPR
jgi:hypothetical protein